MVHWLGRARRDNCQRVSGARISWIPSLNQRNNLLESWLVESCCQLEREEIEARSHCRGARGVRRSRQGGTVTRQVARSPNNAFQRSHSRVTSRAKGSTGRATRRAAERER